MAARKAKSAIAVSVRLDPALYKRLKVLSVRTGRSLSWHLGKTMEEAIEYLEEEIAAIERGREDFRRGRTVEALPFLRGLSDKLKEKEHAVARRVG